MGDRHFAGVALIALLVASSLARADAPPGFSDFPVDDFFELALARKFFSVNAAHVALAKQPDSPEAVSLLLEGNLLDEALPVLRRIVASHPESVEGALKSLRANFDAYLLATEDQRARLKALLVDVRTRLSDWPPDSILGVTRELVHTGYKLSVPLGDEPRSIYQRLIAAHPDTDIGQLAEVDLVRVEIGGYENAIPAYEAIARRHPGTMAAAHALYAIASAWPSTRDGGEADPAGRLGRVLSIVEELRSGRYPRCEWVTTALDLVWRFHTGGPLAKPDAERLLAEYERFVLALDVAEPLPGKGLGELIAREITSLYGQLGPGLVDDLLDRRERRPAARYVLALLALERAKAARRPTARAESALESIANGAPDPYARKALATLAAHRYARGDCPRALPFFRRYLARYSDGDWAWHASLRLADCLLLSGDRAGAAAAYRGTASVYASLPPARILGLLLAARIDDEDHRLEPAIVEYQAALRAWEADFGAEIQHAATRRDEPFQRETVSARLAWLGAMAGRPCGLDVERGRQDLDRHRAGDALSRLDRLPPRCITSQLVHLRRRARLEAAVERGAYERSATAKRRAVAELAMLGSEGQDFVACAADVASATMRFSLHAPEAGTLMRAALDRCVARPDASPTSELEADVTQIRDVIGRFPGRKDGPRIAWSHEDNPYIVARTSLRVSVADGPRTSVRVKTSVAGENRVLFVNDEEKALLDWIFDRLSRPAKMERILVPSFESRPETDVEKFWAQFFGRIGEPNWATPFLGTVRFTDAERHNARVEVELDDGGIELELVKLGGTWRVIHLQKRWMY